MDQVQSPIIAVIGELIRDNPGTISLGQGVVFYSPPSEVISTLTQFWDNPNNHQYKSVTGIPPLLSIIEQKLAQENNIEINNTNCIVVTAGSNMAFMNAILGITSPGDEIIIQTPYYFNHEMAITMASCKAILVPTDSDYQLCLKTIASAITPKTKAIVTISPNNPTGVVYSQSALREVNELCRDQGIYHISDEAYEYFTYNDAKHFSPASLNNSNKHTISLFSLSKAYGFASWRIGYMVIPQDLLMSIKKVQDTILICPPVISQYAALGALNTGISYCKEHLKQITKVREMMLNSLQTISDLVTISNSQGAFYFFLKVNTNLPAFELAKTLIEQHRVAVIPGETFGMNNGCYLRVAYGALSSEIAEEGINRLVTGLRKIVDC
jgi:aspartate/methionine/tyrosine aminotransferase